MENNSQNFNAGKPGDHSGTRQNNHDRSMGFQTEVKGGTANIGIHFHGCEPRSPLIPQEHSVRLPAGVPFQVPPLPTHFVERPEVNQKLKRCLLSETTAKTGTLVVSAIHGLGGIGKSTLAAALAYDPEVQVRFPDGVLWATLGQQPDLLSWLSNWIQALGDYNFRLTTPETASAHLRTLLHGKAVLLVVDDAWNLEDVEPFRVGSSHCRTVITTRRVNVADEMGSHLHQLNVMTEEQSLALLSTYLRRTLEGTEREEACLLAKAVGYLPIALELVAARVARGIPWVNLRCALEEEVARLETLEGLHRRRKGETRLEACFNLSLKMLRDEDMEVWQNFVWLGVLPEDVMVAAPMAATLWKVEEAEAAERLELLWNDALLLPSSAIRVGERTWSAYRIHDLLHDVACRLLTTNPTPGLGFPLAQAHAVLLERYLARTHNGLWHTLPDDSYIHAHLTWHLVKAGWDDEVHQLLREETEEGRNGWYQACDHLGQLASYIKDVARAWQLAEEAFASCPSRAIGLQCRYALIMASLNSLASNIPAQLMAQLVEKQLWTPVQGLSYALRVPSPFDQAKVISKLAPHLPKALLTETLTARPIRDRHLRVWVVWGAAPHIPKSLLPKILAAISEDESDYDQAHTLSSLVPHLPEFLLSKALEAARTIQDKQYRALVLKELALRLPEILPEALTIARTIENERSRAEALHSLTVHLPKILPEALTAARAIQENKDRAWALSKLVLHFPELGSELLETAPSIENENYRALVLEKLVPYLPELLLSKALEAARTIQDKRYRTWVLKELALRLPEILPEALATVQAIENERDRVETLSRLAPHLPKTLLPEALATARAIQDKFSQSEALSGLAQHLPEILPEVLKTAQVIGDEISQSEALSGLVPYCPEILPEALAAARVIKDETYRANILINLVPWLPEIESEALATARAIKHNFSRSQALLRLAQPLPEILPEALAAARAIEDKPLRAQVLSHLVLYFPEIQLEALEAARAIEHGTNRANALSKLALSSLLSLKEIQKKAQVLQEDSQRTQTTLMNLASHFQEILSEALATAQTLDQVSRSQVLRTLALCSPKIQQEALAAAREIRGKSLRAEALSELALYLPEILPEALETARTIKDVHSKGRSLGNLALHSSEILLQALVAARMIDPMRGRVLELRKLAPQLAKLPPDNLYPCWCETLRDLSRDRREDLLRDIQEFSSVINTLGGFKAAAEVARAIQDVGRQWP